ncbi:MAG: EF-hand domain-containing protein [Aeoliella sp.]
MQLANSNTGRNSIAQFLLIAMALMLVAPLVLAAEEDIRVDDGKLFDRLDRDGDGSVTASDIADDQLRLFERLLRQGDEDGDRALTRSEWQLATEPRRPPKPIEERRSANLPGANAARLLLLKLDVDGDAVLTAEEVTKDLRPIFDQVVSQLDRNDDGKVNRMELARGGPQLSRLAQRAVRRLGVDIDKELKRLEREQGSAAKRFEVEPSPQQILSDPKQALALFEQFDGNRDGKLELAEVPEQAQGRFSRLFRLADRDRDKSLTKQEFLSASKRAGEMMSRESSATMTETPMNSEVRKKTGNSGEVASRLMDRMIGRLDRNKDGQINRGEARGRLAERFDEADRNGDGLLDAEEIADIRAALSARLDGKKPQD